MAFDINVFAETLGYYDFLRDIRQRGGDWNTERDGAAPERWFMNEDGWQFQVRDGMLYREHWICRVDYRHEQACDESCTDLIIQTFPMPTSPEDAFHVLTQWVEMTWRDTPEDRDEFLQLYEEADTAWRVRAIKRWFGADAQIGTR